MFRKKAKVIGDSESESADEEVEFDIEDYERSLRESNIQYVCQTLNKGKKYTYPNNPINLSRIENSKIKYLILKINLLAGDVHVLKHRVTDGETFKETVPVSERTMSILENLQPGLDVLWPPLPKDEPPVSGAFTTQYNKTKKGELDRTPHPDEGTFFRGDGTSNNDHSSNASLKRKM